MSENVAIEVKNRAYELVQDWRFPTFHEHIAGQTDLPDELHHSISLAQSKNQ